MGSEESGGSMKRLFWIWRCLVLAFAPNKRGRGYMVFVKTTNQQSFAFMPMDKPEGGILISDDCVFNGCVITMGTLYGEVPRAGTVLDAGSNLDLCVVNGIVQMTVRCQDS